ncbi:MAG: hypothetical protein IPL53_17045 [Ignavibacteria bacterium]|nr:hypothetical protein [Ignavibacteria bacterium]
MQNETSILPFLKTGFSISTPFSFASSDKGIVVSKEGNNDVIRVNNFNFS